MPPIPVRFVVREAVLELQDFVRQVHLMPPKCHEHYKVKNVPPICITSGRIPNFTPYRYMISRFQVQANLWGVEIELIFTLRAGVSDTGRFSKLPYLGMKLGHNQAAGAAAAAVVAVL